MREWGKPVSDGLAAVEVLRVLASHGLVIFNNRTNIQATGTDWVVYRVTAKGFKRLEEYNGGASQALIGFAANQGKK